MKRKVKWGEILLMILAMGVISASIYYVMITDQLVLGGVSGLVLLVMKMIPLPASVWTFLINGGLLLLGYIIIGKDFGLKTVFTSMLMPVYLWIFEKLSPNPQSISGNFIIDIAVLMVVLSFGQAMLFKINASSGGMDIVGKIIHKYLPVKIGTALQLCGFAVCIASFFVYDSQTMVTGLVITYVNGLVVDYFSDGMVRKRKICVISQEYQKIQDYIIYDLCRGATLYQVTGGHSKQPKIEIQTVLEKNEYHKLLSFIEQVDSHAFLTCGSVAEVKGEWNQHKFSL